MRYGRLIAVLLLCLGVCLGGGWYLGVGTPKAVVPGPLGSVGEKFALETAEATDGTGYPKQGDLQTMARAIHGEARGEPYEGQVAVGAVILNRVRHASFPNSVHGVIFQPGAFTAVSDGQIWTPLATDAPAFKAARDALAGWDPTGGCIYYWNPATATSKWIWSRPVVKSIGKHYFAK